MSAPTASHPGVTLPRGPERPHRTAPSVRERVDVLGVLLDRVDLAGTMDRIRRACESGDSMRIVTVNVNFVTLARRQPRFRETVNAADLVVTDGRPLFWATRWLGEPAPAQITGHDLFRECIAVANERGDRVFLLGGDPGVAEELAEKLERENPRLRAEGTDHGRFTDDGEAERQDELMARIRAFRPQFLFVALGAPKQDVWIAKHLEATGAAVAIGVGAVFDVMTDRIKRAPRWMQVCGLESTHRLFVDPGRYWRRYLLADPPTLCRIGWSIVRRRLFGRR